MARGFAGRRHAHELLTAWGSALRERQRPLIWIHAPSVGEGQQAEAVLEAVRERVPDAQFAYTFFSPSAEEWARGLEVDVASYLPWDLPGPMREALDGLAPDLIVFTKTEIWPGLVELAHKRGIPCAIVGASVPPSAGRKRAMARAVLEEAWSTLALGAAIGDTDLAGLIELGVAADRGHRTGDPGVDAAFSRFARIPASVAKAFELGGRPVWIAGSTWLSDEEVVLSAHSIVRNRHEDALLIIAPHEPTTRRVESLITAAGAAGLRAHTLTEVEGDAGIMDEAALIVVDRVGLLGTLYGVVGVAYVGGGFHDQGLHSVVEPAVAGCAVLFGPNHQGVTLPSELLETNGAKIAVNSEALGGQVSQWLEDESARSGIGRAARGYLDIHRGAAGRTADLLNDLIHARR